MCENESALNLNSLLTQAEQDNGAWTSGVSQVFSPVPGFISFSYYETQLPDNPCPASQITVNIEVSELPWAGDDSAIVLCANLGQVDLTGMLSQGADSNGSWAIGGQPTPSLVDVLGLNMVNAEYSVPSDGACPGDVSVHSLELDFFIAFNPGPDLEVCPDFEAVQLGEIPQTGYSYFWFPDDRLDDPFSSQPFISLDNLTNEEVNITYSVLITNGVCPFNEELDVLIHALPMPDLGPDLVICQGETITQSRQTRGLNTRGKLMDSLQVMPIL